MGLDTFGFAEHSTGVRCCVFPPAERGAAHQHRARPQRRTLRQSVARRRGHCRPGAKGASPKRPRTSGRIAPIGAAEGYVRTILSPLRDWHGSGDRVPRADAHGY